jgi:ABC-type proline/glycine betaine transport system ATPase subunit
VFLFLKIEKAEHAKNSTFPHHEAHILCALCRVMVLDNGMIVEFDSPIKLLQNPSGMFYGMAKDARII